MALANISYSYPIVYLEVKDLIRISYQYSNQEEDVIECKYKMILSIPRITTKYKEAYEMLLVRKLNLLSMLYSIIIITSMIFYCSSASTNYLLVLAPHTPKLQII